MSATVSYTVECFPHICEPISFKRNLWKLKLWQDHDEKELVVDVYMMAEKSEKQEELRFILATAKMALTSEPAVKYCERIKTSTECEVEGEWFYRAGNRFPQFYDAGPIIYEVIIEEDENGASWTLEDYFLIEEWVEDGNSGKTTVINAKGRRKSYYHSECTTTSLERYVGDEIQKLENNEISMVKMMTAIREDLKGLRVSVEELREEQKKLEQRLKGSQTTLSQQNERLREDVNHINEQLKYYRNYV